MFKAKIKSILPAHILDALNLEELYTQGREVRMHTRTVKSLNICTGTAMHEILIRTLDFPLGCGEELFALGQILQDLKDGYGLYGLEESKRVPEALSRYLQISSIEGGGSYFYDVNTDRVFDCYWGEEEWMLEDTKAAMFETSMAFFTWYYSTPNEIPKNDTTKQALCNFHNSKQAFSKGYSAHYWLGQKLRRLSYQDQQSIELAFDEKLVAAIDADLG